MTNETKTTATPTLAALIRAAAAFAYEVGNEIRTEDAEAARAFKLVLDDDPLAEFHVSLMLAPAQTVVVSVVTGGKQYIIRREDVLDIQGLRH
jgi:siroheme synthase (precorrin-2 oxidase/ferrochelatase)